MKKSKFFAAALAATMFATAACGLVACDKDPGEITPGTTKPPVSQGTEYTVTFYGTNVTKTTSGGYLGGTMPTATAPSGQELKGWAKTQNATTPDISASNYTSYPFTGTTTTVTLYPVFGPVQGGNNQSQEYIITLDATTNGGSCDSASVTTVNKVLPTLPVATKGTDTFNGWYTAATGGRKIDQGNTADGTYTVLYAQFTPQQQGNDDPNTLTAGQYIKVGAEYRLLEAGQADSANDEDEYYNVKLELDQTTTIALWTQDATSGAARNMNSVKINGVQKYKDNNGTDSYDLEAGSYNIHYKVYTSGWVELDIAKSVDLGDAIAISAADANKCATLTIGDKTIKLYIKDGNNIVDITTTTFYIWTWGGVSVGSDISWPGKKITANMTLDGTLTSDFGFLINKGGDDSKTGDLLEINDEGTYVITYTVGGGSVAPGVVQS